MIPWGGLTCCLSAAVLYLLGRSSGREAELLKKVIRVNKLKELAPLLDLQSKVLPLIVAISGRVGSKTPIKCELSGLRGVMVKEEIEQHYLKHNDTGSWKQDSALVLSMSKEVPWYLDDETGRVNVIGARDAAGFVALTVETEMFEKSGQPIVPLQVQGAKMVGVKRIERLLPTGSSLTVVGEAVKDDVGMIRIQKPHKGPFYVSPESIDELISSLGKWARWYKHASIGLTILGIFLITKHAIHYVLERRHRCEWQQRVLTAAAKPSDPDNEAENGTETKRDRITPDLCVICLEQQYDAVFIRCGHMCCCTTCSSRLTHCPLCRRRIELLVKVFRH